ncbi:MAG TPA: cytochrome P450 [Streptosporangiaceae bacterium]|jgi:cholest-4-en-3-one 26-monooxygenase|nr:cytochrome P450 [Streptosporangiaceae bacterium]
MAEPSIPPRFDFTDPDLYTTRVPMDEFAELRRTAPVWWNAQPRGASGFDDDGYWVVTRHADVLEVSRSSDLYSSQEKTAIIRHAQAVTPEALDMQRLILLNIDPPQHTKLRGIVSQGFTPRAIGRLREALTARAERIVRVAVADGTGDFVTDVAAELPLQAIAELLGIPQEDRRKIFAWSNEMIGYDDPEYDGDGQAAAAELVGYAMAMAQERRACPQDDIVTKLVHAQVDGGELSVDEFGFFVILLAVAGNETTRNAISHRMLAFLDHPDQWELFLAERPGTAADEIVRWATPVTVFQRTAVGDTILGGQRIRAGQRVGLFYRSANFDEEVFDAPERFDILRSPNPHLGFGGTGTHYCLGANLAQLEIDLMFNAIADGMPGIRRAGEAERLRSGWLNGIKRLPVSYQ